MKINNKYYDDVTVIFMIKCLVDQMENIRYFSCYNIIMICANINTVLRIQVKYKYKNKICKVIHTYNIHPLNFSQAHNNIIANSINAHNRLVYVIILC